MSLSILSSVFAHDIYGIDLLFEIRKAIRIVLYATLRALRAHQIKALIP